MRALHALTRSCMSVCVQVSAAANFAARCVANGEPVPAPDQTNTTEQPQSTTVEADQTEPSANGETSEGPAGAAGAVGDAKQEAGVESETDAVARKALRSFRTTEMASEGVTAEVSGTHTHTHTHT